MDDFLYNLRTGNLKNSDRTRKNFDNQRFKKPNRSYQNNRKKPHQHYKNANGLLSAINKPLNSLLDNQKHITEIFERRARSGERKADALEVITAQLKTLVFESGLENANQKIQEPTVARQLAASAGTEERSEGALEKDHRQHIVEIIGDMLNKGETYGQIANHLQSKGVLTLTGRGNWRPQSVSRLYGQALVSGYCS